MRFHRFWNLDEYTQTVLELLLENEPLNNLMIGILTQNSDQYTPDWFLSTIEDDSGAIALISMCTPPLNLLIYEPIASRNTDAPALLARELHYADYFLPGVFASEPSAFRFASAYAGEFEFYKHNSMVIMRLDKTANIRKAPGFIRELNSDDVTLATLWERDFRIECKVPVFTLRDTEDRIRERLGKNTHYIWVDGEPVSQAVHGRGTPNSAVISFVYTPPQFRSNGYAASVVAELTDILLQSNSFCLLFADSNNSISRRLYRNVGFFDVCSVVEFRFLLPLPIL